MATRQRTRTTRTSSSKSPAGNETTTEANSDRTQESAILRAGFSPASIDESQSEDSDMPRVTFVGEQIVYSDRNARIAEAAYLRAERRGFSPGYELDDWLAAEKEIDAELSRVGSRSTQ